MMTAKNTANFDKAMTMAAVLLAALLALASAASAQQPAPAAPAVGPGSYAELMKLMGIVEKPAPKAAAQERGPKVCLNTYRDHCILYGYKAE